MNVLIYPCSRRSIVRLTTGCHAGSSLSTTNPNLVEPIMGNNSAEVNKQNLKKGTWVITRLSGK